MKKPILLPTLALGAWCALLTAQAQPAATANPPAGQTKATNEPADEILPLVQFEDAPLVDVIKTLARQANLNIIFDPRIMAAGQTGKSRPVSIHLENTTAQKVLETVLNNNNLRLERDPRTKISRVALKDPALNASFAEIPIGKALGHWKFDEADGTIAHDSAGAYNGTLSPTGAAFVAGGRVGSALSLSRTNNGFVDVGSVLGMESGDFSVMAWVKMPAGDTTENTAIVSKQRAGYANGYLIAANFSGGPTGGYAAPNKAWFYDSDYHGQEVTSTTSVNDGEWHQIVGVYVAGANKYIYVDGAPAEASNASETIVANPGKLVIGGVDFSGTPGGTFSGLIDEVQIYNYALSSEQVDFLFNHPGDVVPEHVLPAIWPVKTTEGRDIESMPPVVVKTLPVSGAKDVAPGLVEIKVTFSKEMADNSWSWSSAWQGSTPETVEKPRYEADGKTCVLQVKLEPNKTYAYWLNREKFKNFKDQQGHPAVPYLLVFQTTDKPI